MRLSTRLIAPREVKWTKECVVLGKLSGGEVISRFGGGGDYEFKARMPMLELSENWIK